MNLKKNLTAEDLLDGCRKGERKCQEMLYKLLASRMLAVCLRYAKDHFEAEDMLMAGFVKVFQKVADFRAEGSFEGWIRRVMVNTAIEVYRKNQRMLGMVDIEEAYDIEQTAFDMNVLETKELLKLIQQLPAGYRLVFNMYIIEGYSHKEIAAELGISEGASKSQLSRARALLKEKLKKTEGERYVHAG